MPEATYTKKMQRTFRGVLAGIFTLVMAGCGSDDEPATQNQAVPEGPSIETQERYEEQEQTERQLPTEEESTPVIVLPAQEDTPETRADDPVQDAEREPETQSSDTYIIQPASGDNLWRAAQIHYDFARGAHTDIANAVENVAAVNNIAAEQSVSLAADGQPLVLTMPALDEVAEATGGFDWQAANNAAGLDLN